MKLPRVLYVSNRHDFGDPAAGSSHTHVNFFETLHGMGLPVIYFDIAGVRRRHGAERVSPLLAEVARAEKPDVLFAIITRGDDLDKGTVREISESSDTATFNWFCDDHFRFEVLTTAWAPCFNYVGTTAVSALPKYEAMGYENVIKTQWAANTFLYRPPEGSEPGETGEYDVTFVGRLYGDRERGMVSLKRAGMRAEYWGPGSSNGALSFEEMVRVFGASKISLNFSASNAPAKTPMYKLKLAVSRAARRAGLFGAVKGATRSVRGAGAGKLWEKPSGAADQIKGRTFEAPACGGFLISGQAEELDKYYKIGEEIVCYERIEDLPGLCRRYLEDDEARRRIARAGYERTVREHSFVHRFCEIFDRMGAPVGRPEAFLERGATPGEVLDIE